MHTKKLSTLAGFLFLTSMSFAQPIRVELDGRQLSFGQPPVRIGGSLVVPLRGIFEALQAEVKYSPATRSIRANKGNTVVELTLGSREARINGRSVYLDVAADTIGGSTMVPLRFVSEALGAEVKWNGATQTVSMFSGGATMDPTNPPIEQGTKPKIETVTHNATRKLKAGDSFDVVLTGDPGGQASFEILGSLRAQPMQEVRPGRYEARFVIPNGLEVERGVLMARIERGGLEAVSEARRTITIESGQSNNSGSSGFTMEPTPNTQVGSSRPMVRVVFPQAVQQNSIRMYVDQIDVTRNVRFMGPQEIQFTPTYDLNMGQHQVEVVAQSTQGQRVNPKWSFQVGNSANAPQIQNLEPSDGSTTSNSRPRIGASFDRQVNNMRLVIDGVDVTNQSSRTGNQIVWTAPYDLSQGQHNAQVQATDGQNQAVQRAWSFNLNPAAAVTNISSVTLSAISASTGQNIQVVAVGPPQSQATFSLGSGQNLFMQETQPGRYEGNYRIQSNDTGTVFANVQMRTPNGQVLNRQSQSNIRLNPGLIQNNLTINNVADGQTVPQNFNLQGNGSPGSSVTVTVSYLKPDVVSVLTGRQETFTVNGVVSGSGTYSIPINASSVPARSEMTLTVQSSGGQSVTRRVRRQ